MPTVSTKQTANISNIQKCCIHDGPGIRSVIFLMGCPLRCRWCQNPENLTKRSVLMLDKDKCIQCGSCIQGCDTQILTSDNDEIKVDRSRCIGCGSCAANCYTEALTLCGSEMSVDEVYREVMKDEVFYRTSGGGVTVSGGEATLYPEFLLELFKRLKIAGIGTAIETSGYCSKDTMNKLTEYVDVFLYDYKLHSEDLHVKWTGVPNRIIQENLHFLAKKGARIIIRIPLIPDVNDGVEFIKILDYLSQYPEIREINLLPFHQVGASKYSLTGLNYELSHLEECSDAIAENCKLIAESRGFLVNIGGWDIRSAK